MGKGNAGPVRPPVRPSLTRPADPRRTAEDLLHTFGYRDISLDELDAAVARLTAIASAPEAVALVAAYAQRSALSPEDLTRLLTDIEALKKRIRHDAQVLDMHAGSFLWFSRADFASEIVRRRRELIAARDAKTPLSDSLTLAQVLAGAASPPTDANCDELPTFSRSGQRVFLTAPYFGSETIGNVLSSSLVSYPQVTVYYASDASRGFPPAQILLPRRALAELIARSALGSQP